MSFGMRKRILKWEGLVRLSRELERHQYVDVSMSPTQDAARSHINLNSPALLRGTALWLMPKQRLMLVEESFEAQGVPNFL